MLKRQIAAFPLHFNLGEDISLALILDSKRTFVCPSQAKHIMSCYWGASSTAAERHDPSLPYLEQYRIDCGQFAQLFSALATWSCGLHSITLAGRLFRLLDQNKDSLINFTEFVTGLSE